MIATFALPKVQPRVREIGNNVGNMFGLVNIGGWRPTDPFPDHPSGWALDYMVYTDRAKGDAVAQYHIDNAATLGVKYLIWNHRAWNPQQGWHPYTSTDNPHTDHVHVTYQDSGGTIPAATNLKLPGVGDLPVVKQLNSLAEKISSPDFWRRAGIFALGLLLLILAVAFIRRLRER